MGAFSFQISEMPPPTLRGTSPVNGGGEDCHSIDQPKRLTGAGRVGRDLTQGFCVEALIVCLLNRPRIAEMRQVLQGIVDNSGAIGGV